MWGGRSPPPFFCFFLDIYQLNHYINHMAVLVFYYVLVFISGLFLGSFLNLVSDRVVKGKSIIFGGSECEFCGQHLCAKDLIPVFSFIKSLGKCSYCRKKLSWYYPFSEILTGSMFLLAAIQSQIFISPTPPNVLTFLYLLIIFSFFIILFLADAKYLLVPDRIVIPAIVFTTGVLVINYLANIFTTYKSISSGPLGPYLVEAGFFKNQLVWLSKDFGLDIASAILIALFFISLIYISRWVLKREGMGGGDVTLGLFIGVFNGFPNNILAIFLGFITGSVFSLVLIAFGKKTMKDNIPFGPFLILGSMVAFFFGSEILNWYLNLFS